MMIFRMNGDVWKQASISGLKTLIILFITFWIGLKAFDNLLGKKGWDDNETHNLIVFTVSNP